MKVQTDSRGRVTLGSEYADEEVQLAVEDLRDLEDKDVYFHRLGLDVTRRGILDIFMQRRIVMDWNIGGMTNPWIFEKVAEHRANLESKDRTGRGVRADAKALYRLSDEGGVVAAHFSSSVFKQHGIYKRLGKDIGDVILIGEVKPGTEIEPVEYPHQDGASRYMNTLRMTDTVEVHEEQYDELFGNYPRGTIRKWDAKEDLIREIYAEELEAQEKYYRGEWEDKD